MNRNKKYTLKKGLALVMASAMLAGTVTVNATEVPSAVVVPGNVEIHLSNLVKNQWSTDMSKDTVVATGTPVSQLTNGLTLYVHNNGTVKVLTGWSYVDADGNKQEVAVDSDMAITQSMSLTAVYTKYDYDPYVSYYQIHEENDRPEGIKSDSTVNYYSKAAYSANAATQGMKGSNGLSVANDGDAEKIASCLATDLNANILADYYIQTTIGGTNYVMEYPEIFRLIYEGGTGKTQAADVAGWHADFQIMNGQDNPVKQDQAYVIFVDGNGNVTPVTVAVTDKEATYDVEEPASYEKDSSTSPDYVTDYSFSHWDNAEDQVVDPSAMTLKDNDLVVLTARYDATATPIDKAASVTFDIEGITTEKAVNWNAETTKTVNAPEASKASAEDEDYTYDYTFAGWVDQEGNLVDLDSLVASLSDGDQVYLKASFTETKLAKTKPDDQPVVEDQDPEDDPVVNPDPEPNDQVEEDLPEDQPVVEEDDEDDGDETTPVVPSNPSNDPSTTPSTNPSTTPSTTTTTTPAATTTTPAANTTTPRTTTATVTTTPVNTNTTTTPARNQVRVEDTDDQEVEDEDTPIVDEATPLAAADDSMDDQDGNGSAEVTTIEDEDTPLAAAEDNCIIHWIILILSLFAGIYNIVRAFVRNRENEEAKEEQNA